MLCCALLKSEYFEARDDAWILCALYGLLLSYQHWTTTNKGGIIACAAVASTIRCHHHVVEASTTSFGVHDGLQTDEALR